MLIYENQLNLGNIYSNCQEMFKEQRPEFLELLNKYIDINTYIPFSFRKAFYADTGRPRGCSLYGYISALVLQKIFNIPLLMNFFLRKMIIGVALFKKAFIPLNSRATSDKPNCPINENGIPVCPNDPNLPLKHAGLCHEKGRADRDKWICP